MNDYTLSARRKGWLMKEIAERWGITTSRMSQIAKDPKPKDWDALNGLPARER